MKSKAEKIKAMQKRFGDYPNLCGSCTNLESWREASGKLIYKCTVYGVSFSAATDWGKNWTACGMFCKDCEGMTPVYKLPKEPDPGEPLPGQIDIFGGAE